ncbi:MAG TPA: phasin family protein [Dissulfurispiraceae bacterium]|nr:phasin family protein [Dissulfurispiraceae bacterium]
MTVFDLLRNAVLAGFGVQEKMKDFVDDLVKRGELSESQGAKLVKEWSEKADKSTSELNEIVAGIIPRTLEKMSIPTKTDIDALSEQIQKLSARISALENAQGPDKAQ